MTIIHTFPNLHTLRVSLPAPESIQWQRYGLVRHRTAFESLHARARDCAAWLNISEGSGGLRNLVFSGLPWRGLALYAVTQFGRIMNPREGRIGIEYETTAKFDHMDWEWMPEAWKSGQELLARPHCVAAGDVEHYVKWGADWELREWLEAEDG